MIGDMRHITTGNYTDDYSDEDCRKFNLSESSYVRNFTVLDM